MVKVSFILEKKKKMNLTTIMANYVKMEGRIEISFFGCNNDRRIIPESNNDWFKKHLGSGWSTREVGGNTRLRLVFPPTLLLCSFRFLRALQQIRALSGLLYFLKKPRDIAFIPSIHWHVQRWRVSRIRSVSKHKPKELMY